MAISSNITKMNQTILSNISRWTQSRHWYFFSIWKLFEMLVQFPKKYHKDSRIFLILSEIYFLGISWASFWAVFPMLCSEAPNRTLRKSHLEASNKTRRRPLVILSSCAAPPGEFPLSSSETFVFPAIDW